MMQDLSIIIVNWNGRALLRQCLISIRECGGPCVKEVIVVDNASSDASTEMVSREFPDVKLISLTQNVGFARGNNIGIENSTGRWVALVNSDVVVHPGCFERLIRGLESDATVGLAGPKVFGADGKLQRTCRRLPTVWNTFCRSFALDTLLCQWPAFSGREMRHWDQETDAEVEVLSGCFWLSRREAIQQVGGLDERFFFYAEDVDWCKRMRDCGWKVVFVSSATAIHFGGGSSSRAPLRYSIEMVRANLRYWEKHYGSLGKGVFFLLCLMHHAIRLPLRGLTVISSRDETARHKFRRSFACLLWLVAGRRPVELI